MRRSCSSVAGPAAFPAISYRWESSQSGPVTWYSVTCQAQRIEAFRLTLRMVTVPGETWIFSRPLRSPAAPGWLTLTDAQREAAEAFILSQRREGWIALPARYDDGGFTGANMERPALQRLLKAVETGEVDCVVVYKVDRLSRSLLDFTRILSLFEKSN